MEFIQNLFVNPALHKLLLEKNAVYQQGRSAEESRFIKYLTLEPISTVNEVLENAVKMGRIHITTVNSNQQTLNSPDDLSELLADDHVFPDTLSDIIGFSQDGEISIIDEDDAGATIHQITFKHLDERWNMGLFYWGKVSCQVTISERYIRIVS